MIGKKINQLATELAPVSTDLTIIGDPDSGVSKKITLAQLGAIFSGAVSFYTNLAGFPVVGDINVIYCAKDTQKLYLWSGSAYTEVFPSQALLDTYQLRSEKGVSNGYASLDSGGKVPISQLPSSIMEYKGTWNASTNTPTLANGTGDTGDVYICNVAGTVNFGAGPITFAVGDYVIYSGTIWQRSSGAVGTVTSVALTVGGDAISVSGSPLTTSGTLGLTFNGTTAQYIRGNGTLETFPTSLISGTGNVNAIPKFTANTVLGNSVMEDDGNFVSMRGLKINAVTGVGNTINFQQASGITAAGLGYSTIGAAGSTGIKFYLDQNSTTRSFVLDTTTITSDTERTYSMPNSSGTLALTSDIPSVTGYVPYTGATANLDLGTHTLIAAKGTFSSSGSGDTVGITHSSGSGIALNITKGGSGEGLYINKTSGSGNAATIIGTLNATTLVKSGGTSSQFLKADGSVDSTSYGTGSVTSVGLSSATSGVTIGSTPITTSGTITLAIATASGSQQGLLSSTDWTTFNNKQNALTNPVTGTGTTNYLPKFTGASTIGDSQVFDNGTNVGIGTATPSYKLDVSGAIQTSVASGNGSLYINNSSLSGKFWTLIPETSSGETNLLWYYGGAGASVKMNLTNSGNLGLGVSPSAWDTTLSKAIQLNGGSLWGYSTSQINLLQNGFYNTSGDIAYVNTASASAYRQISGVHSWYTAPSGTAGNAISFTQAMTLDASGNLMVGTTSPVTFSGYKTLSVNGSSGASFVTMANGTSAIRLISSTTDSAVWEPRNVDMLFATNNTTRLTLASTGAATFSSSVTTGGNVFIPNGNYYYAKRNTSGDNINVLGFASGSDTLTIKGGTSGSAASIQFADTGGTIATFYNSNFGIGTTSPSRNLTVKQSVNSYLGGFSVERNDNNNYLGIFNDGSIWNIAASYLSGGSYQPIGFFTSDVERMRITSGGNVGIGTTTPGSKLSIVGLPTSSSGLSSGDIWNDSGTLKIV
jgi:hypothetical protein